MAEQETTEPTKEEAPRGERAEGAEDESRTALMRERTRSMITKTRSALRRPGVGGTAAGVAVLAAGALWGVTEALVAGVAGYAVFRTLERAAKHRRRGESAEAGATA